MIAENIVYKSFDLDHDQLSQRLLKTLPRLR